VGGVAVAATANPAPGRNILRRVWIVGDFVMSISNLPADFGAAGVQNGFSTLKTLLSGVAGSGRSALLVHMDLDVRTVRIDCHFDDVAGGLCLWSGPRAGGSFA
jgi:hypothetical protein